MNVTTGDRGQGDVSLAEAKRVAGQAIASVLPARLAKMVRVTYGAALDVRRDGTWLPATVSAAFGVRLLCRVRVAGGPVAVHLLPIG